jgi:hypothetical protein
MPKGSSRRKKAMSVAQVNNLLLSRRVSPRALDKGTAMRFLKPSIQYGYGDHDKAVREYLDHRKQIIKSVPPGFRSFLERVPSLHDSRLQTGKYDPIRQRLTLRLESWYYKGPKGHDRFYVGRYTYKNCRLSPDQLRHIKHLLGRKGYVIVDDGVDQSTREEGKWVHRLLCARRAGEFAEILLDCSDLEFVREREQEYTPPAREFTISK